MTPLGGTRHPTYNGSIASARGDLNRFGRLARMSLPYTSKERGASSLSTCAKCGTVLEGGSLANEKFCLECRAAFPHPPASIGQIGGVQATTALLSYLSPATTPRLSEDFDAYYTWLGIPPSRQPPNYYQLLGITDFEQNADVISYAADRQMTHLRSFAVGPHSAYSQKLLNDVAIARVCLRDPEKKSAYDQYLRDAEAAKQEFCSPVAAPSPANVPPPPLAPPIAIAPPVLDEDPPELLPSGSVVRGSTPEFETPLRCTIENSNSLPNIRRSERIAVVVSRR